MVKKKDSLIEDAEKIKQISKGAWHHLGRVAAGPLLSERTLPDQKGLEQLLGV